METAAAAEEASSQRCSEEEETAITTSNGRKKKIEEASRKSPKSLFLSRDQDLFPLIMRVGLKDHVRFARRGDMIYGRKLDVHGSTGRSPRLR